MLMKNFNKLIALLLATVTLLSAAVACDNNTPSDTTGSAVVDTSTPSDTTGSEAVDTTTPDTNGDTTSATIPPEELFDTPETITIKKEGAKLNYIITRSRIAGTDSNEMKISQELSAYFSEKLGATVTLDTDKARKEDSEKLEIIVGVTDHPETTALLSEMSYGAYILRAVGNKLIVISFSDVGYTRAMKHIKKVLDKGYDESSNAITVSAESISKSEVTSKQLDAIPVYEGGTYLATYDAGRVTTLNECDEIIITDTTASKYDKYLQKLEALGYTKYTENNIGNNKFAIYTNDEYTLNVGYYSYEKSARLLVEPKGALPARAEDNTSEQVTTAQLTMIAVSAGDSANGLSILIRLEDGRFIVIDGAWEGNYQHLVDTIKYQSAGYTKDPVIAAWIITHGHGDHASLLQNSYLNIKSRSGITVERIIMNELSVSEAKNERQGVTGTIIETVAPTLGAELYKAHVGQAFHLSNCKMEVLYTQEAYAPNPCVDYNASSVVMKMTFTDSKTGKVTTFLSTGDGTNVPMATIHKLFGDYIKCDIITVSHHGYVAACGDDMANALRTVAPKLVLWPIGQKDIGRYNGLKCNKALLDGCSEFYCAGDAGGRDVVVPFPYAVGNIIEMQH